MPESAYPLFTRASLLGRRDVGPMLLVDFFVDPIHHIFVGHTTVLNELGESDPLARVRRKFLACGWLRPDVFVNDCHAYLDIFCFIVAPQSLIS